MYNCATWQHVRSQRRHVAESATLSAGHYQLSESTSLLLSSGFSADVLVDLFHF